MAKTIKIEAAELEAKVAEWFDERLNRFTPGTPLYHEIKNALEFLLVKLGAKEDPEFPAAPVDASAETPAPADSVSPAENSTPAADA